MCDLFYFKPYISFFKPSSTKIDTDLVERRGHPVEEVLGEDRGVPAAGRVDRQHAAVDHDHDNDDDDDNDDDYHLQSR